MFNLIVRAVWRRVDEPKPDEKFLDLLASAEDPELVRIGSPFWMHRRMFDIARRFKREFGYDFIQWGKPDRDPKAHGFLFNDDTGTFGNGAIIGGCAFRWRDDHWGLQFIWIAPKARRKGVLSRRWERFREQFGEFEIEPPLSEAMKTFAEKFATPRQRPPR